MRTSGGTHSAVYYESLHVVSGESHRTVFQAACKILYPAVQPVVIASRTVRGKVSTGIGAGMFVNREGWFVTAGHILAVVPKLESAVRTTNARRRVKPDDVTHYSITLAGRSGAGITAHVNPVVDVGVARLEGVTPLPDYPIPKFRIADAEPGEMLCRIGFPFVEEDRRVEWSAGRGFEFSNLFPVPLFVNEALVSRFATVQGNDGNGAGTWIETSSPGLKGQSGGPLADVLGRVCGIQVNTEHYPLGFKGKGRNQVLHVGRAVDSETVRKILDKQGIEYVQE